MSSGLTGYLLPSFEVPFTWSQDARVIVQVH
jgi:hypothetical protein